MTSTESVLPQMLTPAEVQSALGGADRISLKTIRRHAKAKKIPGAVWLGAKLYFQRGPLLAWIEGGSVAQVVALDARRAG